MTQTQHKAEDTLSSVTVRDEPKSVYASAASVFELAVKYDILPTPEAYFVLFAYVNGSDETLNTKIDRLIKTEGSVNSFELQQIYLEMTNGADRLSTSEQINDDLHRNIMRTEKLISSSESKAVSFQAALSHVGAKLKTSTQPSDLSGLVGELSAQNEEMLATTRILGGHLAASKETIRTLRVQLKEAIDSSLKDPLTSVANRRAFDKALSHQITIAKSSEEPLCLVMADLDRFKQVNDEYGHPVGDVVLQGFACVLMSNVPERAMVARYGGEEFAVILPSTSLFQAHNAMIKVLHELRTRTLMPNPQEKIVTASFGIGQFKSGYDKEQFMNVVDASLYAAKQEGRNRIWTLGLSE